MDQKSGVTIMGERKTQLRTYTREDMTQSCTDGLLICDTKSPNRHMDGLLSIANTWTTSKPSVWTMLLFGMKEIDENEMISNLQADYLLWPDTRKGGRIPRSLEMRKTANNRRTATFKASMAQSKLSRDLWNAGTIFIFDNLVGTPAIARMTSMTRTTRLARRQEWNE